MDDYGLGSVILENGLNDNRASNVVGVLGEVGRQMDSCGCGGEHGFEGLLIGFQDGKQGGDKATCIEKLGLHEGILPEGWPACGRRLLSRRSLSSRTAGIF